MTYTAVTFAPVQSFIRASRKLRDLYGSSLLLSHLARAIAEDAQRRGHTVISPASINSSRGVPNTLVIGGDYRRGQARDALLQTWQSLLEACRSWLERELPGETYDWQMFIPAGASLGEYVESSAARLGAEIDAKEAEWVVAPKTREIEDPMTGETITVPIEKSEIVRPNIPDYYAKRRAEYPALGEQLDAMWKGGDAMTAMQARIQAVKQKYPKP